ncbi:hypothetical protein AB0N07_51270, partial [Streptomyces sp. NPDC051172]|uniref:hypothetical protein n=1 Tax=Streptomyces sp. NPDC051172 TaxID=3155796 RepID=UPI00344467A9
MHTAQPGAGRGRVQGRGHVQAAVGGAGDVQPDGDGRLQHHVRQQPQRHELHPDLAGLHEQLPDPRGVEDVQTEPGVARVGVLGLDLTPDQAHRPLLGGGELGARELERLPRQPALDPRPLGPALERAHGHVQRAALAHLLLPGRRRAPLLERVAGGLGHELHADR